MNRYIHSKSIHNSKSPSIILPMLLDVLKPNSILDVGCGTGTWLNEAKKYGVSEVFGIDGEYVDRDLLYENIDSSEFLPLDLELGFNLNKKFDLVICLEVAEHLKIESANSLIESLVRHSDFVFFSAAIPGQGGQNHLNEQWPIYWVNKFQDFGYKVSDFIRPQIWENSDLDFWYKQNSLLFFNSKSVLSFDIYSNTILQIIHPDLFLLKVEKIEELKRYNQSILDLEMPLKFYLSLLKKKIHSWFQ